MKSFILPKLRGLSLCSQTHWLNICCYSNDSSNHPCGSLATQDTPWFKSEHWKRSAEIPLPAFHVVFFLTLFIVVLASRGCKKKIEKNKKMFTSFFHLRTFPASLSSAHNTQSNPTSSLCLTSHPASFSAWSSKSSLGISAAFNVFILRKWNSFLFIFSIV